jgi:hypothetical protein
MTSTYSNYIFFFNNKAFNFLVASDSPDSLEGIPDLAASESFEV